MNDYDNIGDYHIKKFNEAKAKKETMGTISGGGTKPTGATRLGGVPVNIKKEKEKKQPPPLKRLKAKMKVKKNEYKVIPNPDKKLHEKWGDNLHPMDENKMDLFNFPKPFRMLICGPPDSGKSTCVLNVINHLNPPPTQVFLLHQQTFQPNLKVEQDTHYPVEDFEDTESKIPEYADIDAIILKTIPNEKYFQDKKCNKKHSVLIIDDVALKGWLKFNRENSTLLDKLFSYISTHYNVTLLSAFQDFYQQATPSTYRYSNIFTLFKPTDLRLIGIWAQNVGLSVNEMRQLIKYCKNSHDCIVLDNTNDTPAPYRLNFTTIVNFL